MSFIPEAPLSIPKNKTTPPCPINGTRGIFPKEDGWYDINDNGIEKKLAIDEEIKIKSISVNETHLKPDGNKNVNIPLMPKRGTNDVITSENILQNSNCDDLNVWTQNTSSQGMLYVGEESDRKYLALSGRSGAWEGIEQSGIADELNKSGKGQYVLTGDVKVEGATLSAVDFYVIVPSYSGVYDPYYIRVVKEVVGDEWTHFSVVFDTSLFPFETFPEDTKISIRENSRYFNEYHELCIDNVKLLDLKTTTMEITLQNNEVYTFPKSEGYSSYTLTMGDMQDNGYEGDENTKILNASVYFTTSSTQVPTFIAPSDWYFSRTDCVDGIFVPQLNTEYQILVTAVGRTNDDTYVNVGVLGHEVAG